MAYEKEIEELKKEKPIAVFDVDQSVRDEAKKLQEGISIPVIAPGESNKKNKKLIYGIIAVIIVVIAGIGIYAYSQEQKKQQILDSIDVTFVEELNIEYGTKEFDFSTLIKDKTDEVILPEAIDTMTLGETEVVYKVEKEGVTKEYPIKVNVIDTKAPEITFKEDSVSLEYGAEFNIQSNIESVKDPVDGDVSFAESAGENNYYVIEGTVDTSTAGEYTITVTAKDKNGIENEKSYTVNVAEEYVAPQASTGNTGYKQPTYQQPASGGGSSYTPPASNGGGSSTPPANTCDMSVPAGAYKTAREAYDVANGLLNGSIVVGPKGETKPEWANGASSTALFNNCDDTVGYTIYWY